MPVNLIFLKFYLETFIGRTRYERQKVGGHLKQERTVNAKMGESAKFRAAVVKAKRSLSRRLEPFIRECIRLCTEWRHSWRLEIGFHFANAMHTHMKMYRDDTWKDDL